MDTESHREISNGVYPKRLKDNKDWCNRTRDVNIYPKRDSNIVDRWIINTLDTSDNWMHSIKIEDDGTT